MTLPLLSSTHRRPVGTAHAWACRILNAFGDRHVLFKRTTIDLLLDCLGQHEDSGLLVGSTGSLDDVITATLRRIYLDQDVDLQPSTISAIMTRLLWLVSTFAKAHPMSPLPTACQTALELANSLSHDYEKFCQVSPSDELVSSLCAALEHEDGTDTTRLSALDCLQGLMDAYSASEHLFRLLSAVNGSLVRILLRIIGSPPAVPRASSMYADTATALCFLVVLSPEVFMLLCSFGFAPRRASPDWRDTLPARGAPRLQNLPAAVRARPGRLSAFSVSHNPRMLWRFFVMGAPGA